MANRQHDFRHLIEGNQALNVGQGELRGRERAGHTYGVAVLTGDFNESANRVADESKEVGKCDRSCVKGLLGRTFKHLHQCGCGHGGGASHLCLASALCSGYAGGRGEDQPHGGGAVQGFQYFFVPKAQVFGQG